MKYALLKRLTQMGELEKLIFLGGRTEEGARKLMG